MKVPKMYKSSDLYDAGTDVIYDDDSKLQYAPFIYATTGSGDNGGDGGDDEEGEDAMFVNAVVDGNKIVLDKTWKEISDASATKNIVIKLVTENNVAFNYVTEIGSETDDVTRYYIDTITTTHGTPLVVSGITLETDSETGYPTFSFDA